MDELEKLAIEIHESGTVESDKQEYDFDIDLLIRLLRENETLKLQINSYKKYVEFWKSKAKYNYKMKHIYKIELVRCQRKLTRIYNQFRNKGDVMHQSTFDWLKNL